MNPIASQIKLLVAPDARLLMMQSEYLAELAALVPFISVGKELHFKIESYKEVVARDLQKVAENIPIHITTEYSLTELDNSLAYHRISGMIAYDSWWRFSTLQFERDLLAAEANDSISGHFIHISSGGGEAYYLDQLAKTMQSLKKPTYTLIDKKCGSAGYYIASQTNHIASLTPYDDVGCIGVMATAISYEGWYEQCGIKTVTVKATKSDLKNKKFENVLNDKPKQFIKEDLDPLQQQFVSDVKKMRPKIAALGDDHPVLRGETFYSGVAIENGLVDEITTFDNALADAYARATKWHQTHQSRKQLLNTLTP